MRTANAGRIFHLDPVQLNFVNLQSNENWANQSFFTADSAEPLRFKLQCLEVEIFLSDPQFKMGFFPEMITTIYYDDLSGKDTG